MKTLYIIRHAKSSWNFDLPDKHRPLGLKGRRDVQKVGRELSMNENTPDKIITSPASRALYTALYVADDWGYPENDIEIDDRLYMADAEDILEIIKEQAEEVDSIAIFGHNPGFTDLVNHFSSEYVDNVPTCGVFSFHLKTDSWTEAVKAEAKTKMKIIPKRLSS